MREYVTPRMTGETFAANEYIAACWGVACNTDWANLYEQKEGDYSNGVTHDAAHCGNPSNQVIYDRNGDNIADAMIEEGTDGLGNLSCTIYTDGTYLQSMSIKDVKVGTTIYWTTHAADGRIWNHSGKVFASFPGRPNHS